MKNMKNYLLVILVGISFSFCTPIKRTQVKMPRQSTVKWYSKKSLKKYSKEFSQKDWAQKDTIFVPTLDTTLFK